MRFQDLVTLDDQQRFDGFLEKVTLSALDPTDDDLLDQSVDIIAGGAYLASRHAQACLCLTVCVAAQMK